MGSGARAAKEISRAVVMRSPAAIARVQVTGSTARAMAASPVTGIRSPGRAAIELALAAALVVLMIASRTAAAMHSPDRAAAAVVGAQGLMPSVAALVD